MKQEYAYWMALAHLQKMTTKTKNEIIVKIFQEGISIIDLFQVDSTKLKSTYLLSDSEVALFEESKKELASYAFMVEDMLNQGYEILPITSEDYSPILKNNLKRTYSPPLIYVKGNKQILKEKSIAIVGSREASEVALRFTDNVASEASKNFKVVVSGFAKGVDKQALDSAINYVGRSIIVLPQGIMTFDSGYKKYYKQIIDGDVLVLSTFFPKAPWNVKLAMARNPIIYGLADEIYVAESSDKGGTWSGVLDGLRKGRKIFVRMPGADEKNANKLLIEKGALPVDMSGKRLEQTEEEKAKINIQTETAQNDETDEEKILALLGKGKYTSAEIVKKLNLAWEGRRLTTYLKAHEKVQTINKKTIQFTLKQSGELTIFG